MTDTASTLQVLMVDDDQFTIDFATGQLHQLGINLITTAKDGARGLAAYDRAARKPDLVLCDLHMPGSDGFQFMEGLAARNYQGGVLLVSGQGDRVRHSAELMARFHQLQVLGVLEKPLKVPDLSKALDQLRPR